MTYFSALSLLGFGNKVSILPTYACMWVPWCAQQLPASNPSSLCLGMSSSCTAQRFVETSDPPTSLTSYSDPHRFESSSDKT